MNMPLVHVSRVFHLILISSIFIITETRSSYSFGLLARAVLKDQGPVFLGMARANPVNKPFIT